MTNVSIITIGDELLIGQVIDTNSAWMAQLLNSQGFSVTRRVAVGDSRESIWKALDEEAQHAAVILVTGGLGPTADDITKPLLCEYFSGKMVVDEQALKNVRHLFENVFKRPFTERNKKQAEVPDVCTVMQNRRGTAPGMIFEKDNCIFISMPGVPHEMQGMMENDVLPLMKERFQPGQIEHRTLVTFGIGESSIADMILEFENALPAHIKLAYLPNFGMVRLRLTSKNSPEKNPAEEIGHLFNQLRELMQAHVISNEDQPMEKIVAALLLKEKLSMSTAESCTGGYIAHLLTSLPGSSAFYKGSVISYSYQAKQDLLGVDGDVLAKEGAVSEAVVRQMVTGVVAAMDTNVAVAVSGIMGPDGGTDDKPVGTVWMAAGNKDKQIVQKLHFRFTRSRNIQLTAVNALFLLRKFILEDKQAEA
ncbi:MAG: competence/damage-inducible protein CinA [Ferruginibacter sp.]|nr:competence/damage-inducible protein CinA [Ferruginibacter sp.]